MVRKGLVTVGTLLLLGQQALAAKQDILGARVGMTRAQAVAALTNNGVSCQNNGGGKINCQSIQGNNINLVELDTNGFGAVWKIDYTFYFQTTPFQMLRYLVNEYGLTNAHKIPGVTKDIYDMPNGMAASFQNIGNRASFMILDSKLQSLAPAMPKF